MSDEPTKHDRKEATVWATMANEVREYDQDNVKRGKGDVDTLLVFVSDIIAILFTCNVSDLWWMYPGWSLLRGGRILSRFHGSVSSSGLHGSHSIFVNRDGQSTKSHRYRRRHQLDSPLTPQLLLDLYFASK